MKTVLLLLGIIALSGCVAAGVDVDEGDGMIKAQASGNYDIIQVQRGYQDVAENVDWSDDMVIKVDRVTGKTWILFPIDGIAGRDNDSNDHSMSWVPVPEYTPEFLHAVPDKGREVP